jgi:hypothetical protein
LDLIINLIYIGLPAKYNFIRKALPADLIIHVCTFDRFSRSINLYFFFCQRCDNIRCRRGQHSLQQDTANLSHGIYPPDSMVDIRFPTRERHLPAASGFGNCADRLKTTQTSIVKHLSDAILRRSRGNQE